MADDVTQGQGNQGADAAAAAATQAADAQARQAAEAQRLAGIESKLNALADTVTAAMVPRQAAQVQGDGQAHPGQIPANFRTLLRQQGLSDADIDANAPIVVPFLSAMLATDGAVIAQAIQGVKDEVDMVKAGRQTKQFPYWNELEDNIHQLREDARKSGQYLSPKDAYQAALALDVHNGESKVASARERARASSAADASAQEVGAHHGSRPGSAGQRSRPVSAEDLTSMSREERKKYFEGAAGDLPVR